MTVMPTKTNSKPKFCGSLIDPLFFAPDLAWSLGSPAPYPQDRSRDEKRQLTQWKKVNPFYKDVHSQVTQDVVKRLHNTWEAFKARGFGFPRSKKYGRYQSFLFPQFKENPISGNQTGDTRCGGFLRTRALIKLPKIGEVTIKCHRPIPEGFKVKGVRIVARARGTIWYAKEFSLSN